MKNIKNRINLSCLILLASLSANQNIEAQQYANEERTAIAVGHYARARALLIEAIAEFERGKNVARPDMLVDSEQWRLTVVSKAEELNRLLDPQPRITKAGVRYQAQPSLIRRDSKTAPEDYQTIVHDGNNHAEERRALQATNATSSAVDTTEIKKEPRAQLKPSTLIEHATRPAQPVLKTEDTLPTEAIDEEVEAEQAEATISAEATQADITPDEDSEISRAIEAAIRERLMRMDEGEGFEE